MLLGTGKTSRRGAKDLTRPDVVELVPMFLTFFPLADNHKAARISGKFKHKDKLIWAVEESFIEQAYAQYCRRSVVEETSKTSCRAPSPLSIILDRQ